MVPSTKSAPAFVVSGKLKKWKAKLKLWNKECYGNIFQSVAEAEDNVLKCQFEFDTNPSHVNFQELDKAKRSLLDVQLQEERFWRDKSRATWLSEGDRNTSYFNSLVMQKRQINMSYKLKDSQGNWVSDLSIIHVTIQAVDHYQQFFSSEGLTMEGELLNVISSLITNDDNHMLTQVPSMEKFGYRRI